MGDGNTDLELKKLISSLKNLEFNKNPKIWNRKFAMPNYLFVKEMFKIQFEITVIIYKINKYKYTRNVDSIECDQNALKIYL